MGSAASSSSNPPNPSGSPNASAAPTGRRRTSRAFHPDAYKFVFAALQYSQERLSRSMSDDPDDDAAHISGPELLDGIRALGLRQYGLLARTVFESWGVRATADFGRIVFDLIEKGDMRKTDRDQEEDFHGVYDFGQALEADYQIDAAKAFAK